MWKMLRFLRLTARQEDSLATSGPFDELPLEIIQHIASCLPASSAAAFALTNHYLRQAIESQYWARLHEPSGNTERAVSLQLLDRDLHDHLFCHRRARLHLPTQEGVSEWTYEEFHRRWRRRCFHRDMEAKPKYYYPHSFPIRERPNGHEASPPRGRRQDIS
jgi:hypothetical protein